MTSQPRIRPRPTTRKPQSARYALVAALYKEELGRQIKRRREDLGLTQTDLAELIPVKESQTISRWERGERAPNDLEALARALQTTAAEMLAELSPVRQTDRRRMMPGSQLDRIEAKLDELLTLAAPADPLLLEDEEEQAIADAARPAPVSARGRAASGHKPGRKRQAR